MKALLLIALMTAGHAATILDVSESRSSSATSTLGFVLHGTGDGWRVTGGWSWSPTVSAVPVGGAGIPATISSPVVLDVSALEINADRWTPTSTGYLVGNSPQGELAQFRVWLWQSDHQRRLRLDTTPLAIVPEPTGAVLIVFGSLALLRRRREGGGW